MQKVGLTKASGQNLKLAPSSWILRYSLLYSVYLACLDN